MNKPHLFGPLGLLLALLAAMPAAMAANVAMLGTASQSSDLSGFIFPGDAKLAIDGNRDGNYFNHSVTITNNTDPSPSNDGLFDFWQLQLDQQYTVSNLLLFGRTDCSICLTRIDPFRLELFDGLNTVFSQDVTTFREDILATVPQNIRGMVFNFDNLSVDRVKITLLGRNFLEIAEVEINSVVPVPVPPALPLLFSALLGVGLLRRRARI